MKDKKEEDKKDVKKTAGGPNIQIKPRRAVEGIGGPGETVTVDKKTAERLINQGYAVAYSGGKSNG